MAVTGWLVSARLRVGVRDGAREAVRVRLGPGLGLEPGLG